MGGLQELSAIEVARGVAAGTFSAAEVCEDALAAIEARDGEVQAFLEVSAELARAAAAATDARRARGETLGPLAGVPVAVKDNLQLMGTHTTCASRMLAKSASVFTATAVTRLIDAGATIVGKTNMDEFAFGSSTEASAFQVTHNPWDLSRVPGGSSGGSAAALAAGEVSLSVGSDTGGSVRQPAALCGVVGMRPSYGAVSRYGLVAFGSSLDQVGPMGRSVEDVALTMCALTAGGTDPLDATSRDCSADYTAGLERGARGLTIGVAPSLMEHPALSPEVRDALALARSVLVDAGARVVEVELPHMEAAIAAYYVIGPAEAFSNLARFDGVRFGYQERGCATLAEQTARSRAHGFGLEARRRQLLGAYLLASGVYDEYYLAAARLRTLITRDYARVFARADALLLPSTPSCAWRIGEVSEPGAMYASDLFTVSLNIAGNCGISVPMGRGTDSGMPVAAQLQGPAFGDATLLCVARALERGVEARGICAPGTIAPAYAGGGVR